MRKTWTTTRTIQIDEIIRFDGKAGLEAIRAMDGREPDDIMPMRLFLEGRELVAHVLTPEGIMVAHKGDCLVRHGDDLWVIPADQMERLLKRTHQ